MRREAQLENGLYLLEVYLYHKYIKAVERKNYSQIICYSNAIEAVKMIKQGKNDELKKKIEELDN